MKFLSLVSSQYNHLPMRSPHRLLETVPSDSVPVADANVAIATVEDRDK